MNKILFIEGQMALANYIAYAIGGTVRVVSPSVNWPEEAMIDHIRNLVGAAKLVTQYETELAKIPGRTLDDHCQAAINVVKATG